MDRDTTPEMAKAAMQLMVDFMLEPENMMEILEEIEEERSRIFWRIKSLKIKGAFFFKSSLFLI